MAVIHEDAISGRNGFEQFGYAAPIQPQAQPGAIATPGSDQPAAPSSNPFKTTADGMYKNQRGADQLISERRAAALETLYSKLGEPEKAMMAREQMADLFDKGIERKFKTLLLGAAQGAPGSMDALAKAYSYMNDGQSIDPNSGRWDADSKTWKGVTFTDASGKKMATRDLSQADILGMAKRDASAIAMFNIEQGWKQKEYGLKERSTRADETRAGAAAAEVAIKKPYYEAYANRLNAQTDVEKSGANQKATVDAVNKMFPGAFKEYKIEDAATYGGKEGLSKKIKERDTQLAQRDAVLDLVGLNPKINPSTLRSLVMQGEIKNPQTDSDGRLYVMQGKDKIFLQ
jgi:molybdopterin converting factor small subunit